MTTSRIKELATEVAAEVRQGFKGFSIDKVDSIDNALEITFHWTDPYRVTVTINLRDYDTDESVKDDIRRQLQTA